MILVDTSVWIELLAGRMESPGKDGLVLLATCGPVVQEVFAGLRAGRGAEQFMRDFRALPCLSDPMPREVFEEGAEIFREGRRHGYTVRSMMDCLIAAVAIRNQVPVWHRDRDYDQIAKYTKLRIAAPWHSAVG